MKRRINVLLALVMAFTLLFTSTVFAADVYTVKSGDVLWKIARANGTTWQKLAEINELKNPHLIFPNQKLKLMEEKLSNKTLQILHTNDMHGFFVEGKYQGMGAAKLKTIINEKRAANPNTLLLDAGDAMQGANLVTLNKGAAAVTLMNDFAYDAMVAGNHEFDYGVEKLMENKVNLNFPILAANVLKEDGKPLLDEYIIKDMNGIKVGIIGYATPETKFKSHPKNTEGITFEDPVKTTNRLVKMLREEKGVDFVIGVAHLGETGDWPAKAVGEAGGVDLIVDGHSHVKYENGIMAGETLIVSTGDHTKNLGIVTVEFDKDMKVVSKKAELFTKEMAKEITPDPETAALIDKMVEENKVIEEKVVANTTVELDGVRLNVRTGETNLGNLITASMLDVSGADIALMNGGGIRKSISVGDITMGEILEVLPFGNTIQVFNVTGQDLHDAIENGLKNYPKENGGFPHIGGMTVKFDASKEVGKRVVSITVKGEALDPQKTYSLVTNDFLHAGGDGYKMFKGKPTTAEFNTLDAELITYMTKNGTDAGAVTGRMVEVNGMEPVEGE